MATSRNPVVFPSSRIEQAAQRAALGDAHRLDRLSLDSVAKRVPTVDVHSRIRSARVLLTLEGASTLTIGLHDPDWDVEASGLLTPREDGRISAVDVKLDTITFRLVKASRQDPDTLTLTFEDRAVALLRQHNKPLTASRGKITRAQFIERMVREVKSVYIPFYSPEKSRRQVAQSPSYPDVTPRRRSDGTRDTGFDPGARFKIAKVTADAAQMREVATSLTVADQENAPRLARLAMICAGIGESGFRPIMNRAGSDYGGVFQGNVRGGVFKINDTEGMARSFLRGGKGFQGGGAIHLANTHPDWGPGLIAVTVEGSRANFASDYLAEHHYGQWKGEAEKILSLWNSGDGGGGTTADVLRVKRYQFTRGQGGNRETSWAAANRLAEEVQWRFYVVAGVAAFVSDDYTITLPAGLTLTDPGNPALLERPRYDLDNGKIAGTVDLAVHAERWATWPGEVVSMDGSRWGPVAGRWLLLESDQNIIDPTDCTVTLTKPLPPLKEPAGEVITRRVRAADAPAGDGGEVSGQRGNVAVDLANGDYRSQTTRPDGRRVLPKPYLTDFLAILAGPDRFDDTIYTNTYSRHSEYSPSSGLVSDHWTGEAADLNVTNHGGNWPNPYGTRLVYQALLMCGLDHGYARSIARGRGSYTRQSWVRNHKSYSVQILWGPGVGHTDHVHIGIHPA